MIVGQASRRRQQRIGNRGPLGLTEQRVLDRLAGEHALRHPEHPDAFQVHAERGADRSGQQTVTRASLPAPAGREFGLQGAAEPRQIGPGVDAIQAARDARGRPRRALRQRARAAANCPRATRRRPRGPGPISRPIGRASATTSAPLAASPRARTSVMKRRRLSAVARSRSMWAPPPVAVLAEPVHLRPPVGAVVLEPPTPLPGSVDHPGASADPLPGRHRHRPPTPVPPDLQRRAESVPPPARP